MERELLTDRAGGETEPSGFEVSPFYKQVMGFGGKRKRSGGPFSRRTDRRRSFAPRRPNPLGSKSRCFLQVMGRTRSGGPRFCADRSGAETEPLGTKGSRSHLLDKKTSGTILRSFVEQVMGIEPTYPAWKAGVLPLNYTCIFICPGGFRSTQGQMLHYFLFLVNKFITQKASYQTRPILPF